MNTRLTFMTLSIRRFLLTLISLGLVMGLSSLAWAQSYFTLEGASIWQSYNVQRIPGDDGTRFSVDDFDKGPFYGFRFYAGHRWNDKHEVRFLYAPLDLRVQGQLRGPTRFRNTVFAAGVETEARYRFDSYRLTYSYNLEEWRGWQTSWGFTGKVRDAEVGLRQGSLRESKSNVGFVPLLHLRGHREIAPRWLFRFDLDGLASPQGRAFDLALTFEKALTSGSRVYGGYRTLEGGADNDTVYNFAWFQYAILGFTLDLP